MLVLVLPPGRVFLRSSSARSAPAETNTSAIRVSVDALGRVRLLSRLVDRAKGIVAALTHSFDAFVRPPECCDLVGSVRDTSYLQHASPQLATRQIPQSLISTTYSLRARKWLIINSTVSKATTLNFKILAVYTKEYKMSKRRGLKVC